MIFGAFWVNYSIFLFLRENKNEIGTKTITDGPARLLKFTPFCLFVLLVLHSQNEKSENNSLTSPIKAFLKRQIRHEYKTNLFDLKNQPVEVEQIRFQNNLQNELHI